MFRSFRDIVKDMTSASVHTPTVIGNERPKKSKWQDFKAFIGQPVVAKRALQPNGDSATCKSPFDYDVNALGSLRPDQVPRFFGALTDGDKLPTKEVNLADLHAMQDRVDPAKVEGIATHGTSGKKAVVVQHNGKSYIADGHHRLAADWLAGKETAEVHFKDLEPVDQALKRINDADFTFISKIEESEGLVFGWAIISKINGEDYYDLNIDTSGPYAGQRVPEHIPEAVMLKCSGHFMMTERAGNEMHAGPDRGVYVFGIPLTTDILKSILTDENGVYRGPTVLPRTGFYVGLRAPPDILEKFKSKEYRGFSIEGRRLRFDETK